MTQSALCDIYNRVMRLALVVSITTVVVLQMPGAGEQEAPAILISRQLSEASGLRVGDVARLAANPGGASARDVRIAGVYEPIPDPSRINAAKHEVRLHLPDLLSMTADPRDPLAGENVDAITIALANDVDPRGFSRDLAGRVPAITVRPVSAANAQAGLFVVLERFHLAIALVTIVASTAFLLALTVMLVDERREIVGVLRLIGLTSRRILAQIFVEGLLIATAGSLFGIALAAASQGLIKHIFQWRYDTALMFVQITPSVVWRCFVIAVPLGVAGSVVASWVLLRRSALGLVGR
jgi:putative ABC transport system permease protein